MKNHILLLSTFVLALSPFGFSQQMGKLIPANIQQNESTKYPTQQQAIQVNSSESGAKLSFQGSLFKNGEAFNGNAKLEFTIQIDSNSTWTEIHESVPVINGLYSIVLGQFNGLPANLFYKNKEQNLNIKVDDSLLGDVTLYAPIASQEMGIPAKTTVNELDVQRDTVYHIQVNANNTVRGLQVDMNGTGLKFPIRGNNNSSAGDDGFKIAILGSSVGEGTGGHEGIRGQAVGNGFSNSGVLGLAIGGSGEEGSYSNGVIGQAHSNGYGNVGIYGLAGGSIGVDNIGVVGISNTGDSTNFEIENKGVLGRAEGPGINKAIWGRAENGQENWAGWFEGDLFVSGKIISDNGISGKLPLELAGANGNRSINLASEGPEGNDGVLRLADGNGYSRVTMFANHYENVLDSTQSTDSTSVYNRVYNGAGGLWFGGSNGSKSVFMSSNGENGSNGYIEVSDDSGSERGRFGINQFESGFARGEVSLSNNSDNRNSSLRPDQLYFFNDQGGYPGWFGTYANSGFSQLIGYDSSNNVTGALLTGFFHSPNPQIYLEDEHGMMRSRLTINDEGAGMLHLNGPESSNIGLISKTWEGTEGADLPYVYLRGSEEVGDSTNGFYLPDLVSLHAEQWSNSQAGSISLISTDGSSGIRMYGGADFESDGNIYSHIALDGANNNHIYLNGNGDIDATGSVTATSLNQTSDKRFKKDIVVIDGALDKINLLNGYTYFWNKKAEQEKGIQASSQQIGVLAQEIEEIFPQLVTTDDLGYKSVNYASLAAVLIEAIKELTNEVSTLKEENAALETKVASVLTLEQRLEKLELLLGLKPAASSNAVNNK